MLSDEEKEAIEYFKNVVRTQEYTHYEKVILNLIEKQQKENLEIRDWKYTIDTIEDLDKLKELDLIKIKGKEYISKDKIKAKIEEYEDYGTSIYYGLRSNGKAFHQAVRMEVKEVLQSLLEKE